jgi:poly(3-hydroxybutyrate) depolymerase
MIPARSALIGAWLAVAPMAFAQDGAIPITEGLAIAVDAPRSASRTLLRLDAAEFALVRGEFGTPKDGQVPAWMPVGARTGGPRAWSAVKAGADGAFVGDQGTPLGDALSGGWIWTTVTVPADCVMLLEASGHGSVFVNGNPRGGDPYSWGFVQLPVSLKAGANELLFSVGRGRLATRLVQAPSPAFIAAGDILVPDLVAGSDTDGPIGVVVVNASAEPLRGARVRVQSDLTDAAEWVDLHHMPALTVKKVALPSLVRAANTGKPGSTRTMKVELADADGNAMAVRDVTLRTVAPADRRNVTRLSTVDGSVQYYAVVPSTAGRGDPAPGILFSLHGAGVEASGQAACYAPKKEAHVVCPTNRRPFGFDWEDWGRIDFAETAAHARGRLANDPMRTWLTGHSMGGHGTWQLGAHFPGEFAAIAPSAGWISFQSYVGAGAGGATGSRSPAVEMLRRAANASNTLALKENLRSQGIYVLHGDADDNVPVTEARAMFKQMAALPHPDFEYFEQPGAGHWWGNECVDWPPLTQFLFRHALVPAEKQDRVRFSTVSPQVSQRKAWVRVQQQELPMSVSTVDAALDRAARTVTVTTRNVAMLDLAPPLEMPAPDASSAASGAPATAAIVRYDIDGEKFEIPQRAARIHVRFERRTADDGAVRWLPFGDVLSGAGPGPVPPSDKKPARGGPFKNAFAHGFVAVVGTQGDDQADALIMAKARYDAEQWWVRGNGRFEILLDRAFDPKEYAGRNVVLYGNHDHNSAWDVLLGANPPVDVRGGSFKGPVATHSGDDVAAFFVRPRADCDQGQVGVIAATGELGWRAAMRTPVFVAGVGFPDLVAFRASMLRDGSQAIVEAGYFGNDWSVEYGTWMQREVPLVEPE